VANRPSFRLRGFLPPDTPAIHRINDEGIPHVTPFAPGELRRLAEQATYFQVAESASEELEGFLLALDETADYASLNFQWFKARYPRFTYVDRIVVRAAAQGKGIGRQLYASLAESAAARGSPLLACEVNLRPPNPRSLRFHAELRFREVGTQDTEGGKKTVSLMIREP
jgi:uncharacterized protein